MFGKSKKILSDFCLGINSMELMSNLSIAEKQIVEIARAVHTLARASPLKEQNKYLL